MGNVAETPENWPHPQMARRIRAAGHDWFYLDSGAPGDTRPVILMLHGAGGSGHSFRHLIPLLQSYRLIAPDLPGQGLTRTRPGARFGLEPMTADIAALCDALGVTPAWTLGHSAGAAIALNLARQRPPRGVIGINAALGTFEGVAGVLFPLMARALAMLPLVPQVVSRLWGNQGAVDRLLASNGSVIDAAGQAQYLALVRRPQHVAGTLGMMASWDLGGLNAALPALDVPVLLIAAEDDPSVPARISRQAVARMRHATLAILPRGGHLLHEVDAAALAARITPFLTETAPA